MAAHAGQDYRMIEANSVRVGPFGNILSFPNIQNGILTTKDSTDQLTNKTFDVSATGNALSNVVNANVSQTAAIARAKLAASTPFSLLVNSSTGDISQSAVIGRNYLTPDAPNSIAVNDANGKLQALSPVAYNLILGGSGQVIANVPPSSTSGLPLVSQGSSAQPNYATLGISAINSGTASSGQYPAANGTGGATWTTPSGALDQSYEISGVGLSAVVAGNNLTTYLVQKDGSTACAACKVGFRNATSTIGGYAQATIATSTPMTSNNGASFGTLSGAPNQYIYAYSQYNSGTPEMCLSGSRFDEGSLVTSTTISAAATSKTTLYCSTGRSNQPIRYLGRFQTRNTTAGKWTRAPDEIAITPHQDKFMTNWVNDTDINPVNFAQTQTQIHSRRVGDEYQVRGNFICGSSAGSPAAFILPWNYTVDTTKIATQANGTMVGVMVNGKGTANALAGQNAGPWAVFYDGSTTNQIFIASGVGASANTLNKSNASSLCGASEMITFYFNIPITQFAMPN